MESPHGMKQVLFITYVFPPIAYAGTYRTLRFCRYLPGNGWLPVVLTIKKGEDLDNDERLLVQVPAAVKVHRTRTIDVWRWWQRITKNGSKRERKSNHGVVKDDGYQVHVPQTAKTKWLSRAKTWVVELVTTPDHMVFWVPFALAKGIYLLLRNDIRVIYTSSPPHSEHLVGLILSKLFKKPWVADFRDPILDSSGYNPATHFRWFVDKRLEKVVVHNAHKVLIISDHYAAIIKRRYSLLKHKFVTLPNGYDPVDFEKVKPAPFQKFTILYAGSFYANRSPRFFLRGFGLWYKKQPADIKRNVQIIFYGIMPPEVFHQIEQEGLRGVVLTPGLVSKDELIPKLLGADVLLLIIGFDSESRGIITSKIFEYMACKRLILAIVPEGDAADILRKYERAFLITSEDQVALEESLTQAYSAYALRLQDGDIGREGNNHTGLFEIYDARNQTRRLAEIFESMISTEKVRKGRK